MWTIPCSAFPGLPIAVSLCDLSTRRPSNGQSGGSTAGHHPNHWIRRWLEASTMASAPSMGMIRSRESEFGRASSGPTSLQHRAIGSRRIRQTRARPGRQTGCRTSDEFADRGDQPKGRMASWTGSDANFGARGDSHQSVCNVTEMRAQRFCVVTDVAG